MKVHVSLGVKRSPIWLKADSHVYVSGRLAQDAQHVSEIMYLLVADLLVLRGFGAFFACMEAYVVSR